MSDTAAELEVLPTDLQMRRIDPVCNMRRFYRMSVQPDLFGGASLVREWGRIGSRGRIMIEQHTDEGRAITSLMKLAAAKRKRGYVIVSIRRSFQLPTSFTPQMEFCRLEADDEVGEA